VTGALARPVIPGERYARRLERAGELLAGRGFDALLVGVGPDMWYLTGYEAMPLERLTMVVVLPGQAPRIVVPRLERPAA
jgi:Xaa-Pro aminopeptidase